MTAGASIEPARFLADQLDQASPDPSHDRVDLAVLDYDDDISVGASQLLFLGSPHRPPRTVPHHRNDSL